MNQHIPYTTVNVITSLTVPRTGRRIDISLFWWRLPVEVETSKYINFLGIQM